MRPRTETLANHIDRRRQGIYRRKQNGAGHHAPSRAQSAGCGGKKSSQIGKVKHGLKRKDAVGPSMASIRKGGGIAFEPCHIVGPAVLLRDRDLAFVDVHTHKLRVRQSSVQYPQRAAEPAAHIYYGLAIARPQGIQMPQRHRVLGRGQSSSVIGTANQPQMDMVRHDAVAPRDDQGINVIQT